MKETATVFVLLLGFIAGVLYALAGVSIVQFLGKEYASFPVHQVITAVENARNGFSIDF